MRQPKSIFSAFIAAVLCMLTTTVAASTNDFKYDVNTCTTRVSRNDGEILQFTKTPWKCTFSSGTGELVRSYYFDRQGTPRACGNFLEDGEYTLTAYEKDGKNFNVYHIHAKHNEQGDLETTTTKDNNQRWKITFLYDDKKVPEYLYHNSTTHLDKYGNWIFAGAAWKDGIVRKMYYYDDGYDAEEDARVDEICKNEIERYKSDKLKSSIQAIPSTIVVIAVALIIKICWLLLVVYLLLLLFKREWAYRPFNRYAGVRVTPRGLFCKTQLHGIIPVLLLFGPSLIMFGTITKAEWNGDVFQWSLVMIGSLALSLVWCWMFVKRKAAEIGRKPAIAIIAFAVWSILAVVAVIAIAVVAIWVAIVLVFLFAGLSSAIGGFIAGTSGATASAAGAIGSGSSSADNEYEPMLDPSNGDDGGILEGTSRVPLRDNHDGTMTDNKGRLYAKDGDRVRRL